MKTYKSENQKLSTALGRAITEVTPEVFFEYYKKVDFDACKYQVEPENWNVAHQGLTGIYQLYEFYSIIHESNSISKNDLIEKSRKSDTSVTGYLKCGEQLGLSRYENGIYSLTKEGKEFLQKRPAGNSISEEQGELIRKSMDQGNTQTASNIRAALELVLRDNKKIQSFNDSRRSEKFRNAAGILDKYRATKGETKPIKLQESAANSLLNMGLDSGTDLGFLARIDVNANGVSHRYFITPGGLEFLYKEVKLK